MSNFLLRDPDCIFIHIPKTGGSTIRRGLWSRYESPAFGQIPPDWPDLYRFAFIRHPLDRFLSAYSDFNQLRGYTGSVEEFAAITMDESILYDERRSTMAERIRHHAIPQTHPFNCLALAQELYRFEQFESEVARLRARMALPPAPLQHRRRTRHHSWQESLSPALQRQLTEYYKADFTDLGYPLP